MHPLLFQTDLWGLLSEPWPLYSYGLLIATGFLLAMGLSKRQAQREGEDPERVVDLAFYVLLWGLVGARVIFIFTQLDDYLHHPLEILKFWRGGLVWYGGFIAAALYIYYYSRRHHLSYFKYVDMFIPYMALAHAFGRLGCLAAGCCFGKPTHMPWGIVFPKDSMAHFAQKSSGWVGPMDPSLPVHPTQLYEAGAEMAMFWILLLLRRNKRFHGQLFLIWLSAYPILRSLIEIFRGDKDRGVYILSTSQYISIGVGGAAVALYLYLRRVRLKDQRVSLAQASAFIKNC